MHKNETEKTHNTILRPQDGLESETTLAPETVDRS